MSSRITLLLRRSFSKQSAFLLLFGWQLALALWSAPSVQGQGLGISGANLEGTCPAACGIRVDVKNVKLREKANGIDAVVDWDVQQSAPEIKLKGFNVTVVVEFKRISRDETQLSVSSTQRQAVVSLTQSGKNKDIKFSDVTSVKATVAAIADPLPSLAITDLPSIKIVGQGGDSAVDVSWRPPTPLACSADKFLVTVKAINEKGDRLNGDGTAATTARSLRVQLKGDLNKKGLRNPEATVTLQHSLIVCQKAESFSPVQEGFSASGSSNAPNPVVTLKPLRFSEAGSRIESEIFWDVVEPQGFKATKFDLKVETDRNGNIGTLNLIEAGEKRSTRGPESQVGDGLRSVTVTIKATFTNANNTAILTRENKLTQKFTAKSTLPKAAPVTPAATSVGLNATGVNLSSTAGVHTVVVLWTATPPAGVTITSFEVEVAAAGNQKKASRSTVAGSVARKAVINFTVEELGTQLKGAQVKITATAQRADGSTFQQTVSRKSN